MRDVRELIRSDRGFALVDTMVSVIVLSITMLGLSVAAVTVTNILEVTRVNAERTSYLRTLVNDMTADPGTVTAATAARAAQIGGYTLNVLTWADIDGDTVTAHAATSSTTRTDGSECADPADLPATCVTTQSTVSIAEIADTAEPTYTDLSTVWVNPAFADGTGAATPAQQIGTFTAPAATTSAKFIVNLSAATAAGRIVFADDTGVIFEQPFDQTTAGDLFGRLPTVNGRDLTVTVELDSPVVDPVDPATGEPPAEPPVTEPPAPADTVTIKRFLIYGTP